MLRWQLGPDKKEKERENIYYHRIPEPPPRKRGKDLGPANDPSF